MQGALIGRGRLGILSQMSIEHTQIIERFKRIRCDAQDLLINLNRTLVILLIDQLLGASKELAGLLILAASQVCARAREAPGYVTISATSREKTACNRRGKAFGRHTLNLAAIPLHFIANDRRESARLPPRAGFDVYGQAASASMRTHATRLCKE